VSRIGSVSRWIDGIISNNFGARRGKKRKRCTTCKSCSNEGWARFSCCYPQSYMLCCKFVYVGLARTIYIYTPYMIVCMVISLLKIPYVHRMYMVLANPMYMNVYMSATYCLCLRSPACVTWTAPTCTKPLCYRFCCCRNAAGSLPIYISTKHKPADLGFLPGNHNLAVSLFGRVKNSPWNMCNLFPEVVIWGPNWGCFWNVIWVLVPQLATIKLRTQM
jgi:hypothetical protein